MSICQFVNLYNIKYTKLLIISAFLVIVIIALTIEMHKSRQKKIVSQPQHGRVPSQNQQYTINTPIINNLNGKSYTYHTLDSIHNSGATDLVFNNYKM